MSYGERRVRGTSGGSLGEDGAVEKMGVGATRAGSWGERKFAEIIDGSDLAFVPRWQSLRIPTSKGDKYRPDSDVDFAFANGNTIVLLDVKNWRGGFLWSMSGWVMDGFKRVRDRGGKPRKLGRNMAMARDRYQKRVDLMRKTLGKRGALPPPVTVVGMVVFVPNKRGVSPTSVRFLRFPGTVGSYTMDSGMRKLRRLLGRPKAARDGETKVNPAALKVLDSNVR